MNIASAVKAAQNGEEVGFSFLYRATWRDKYYIALKYMGNDADAQDVLQEAYAKAFRKLDALEDPEKFPAWLGRIVANTAKNALEKKRPTPFTELEWEEDGSSPVDDLEEDAVEAQPELAISRKETKELVRELIGSLSDEQRICVLLFYLEGQSVREIAEALDCSENTVKSRLNYGRKAIRKQVEQLQKRGYLLGAAPMPLLLRLLRNEQTFPEFSQAAESAMQASGSQASGPQASGSQASGSQASGSQASGSQTSGSQTGGSQTDGSQTGGPQTSGPQASSSQASSPQTGGSAAGSHGLGTTVKETAKQTLMHTALGKTLASVVAAVIVGTAVGGAVIWNNSRQPDESAPSASASQTDSSDAAQNDSSLEESSSNQEGSSQQEDASQTEENPSAGLGEKYKQALAAVTSKQPGYDFSAQLAPYTADGNYRYALYDIDSDTVPELLVSTDAGEVGYSVVFTCADGAQPVLLKGGLYENGEGTSYTGLVVPKEGTGLYSVELSRANGQEKVYPVNIVSGEIKVDGSPAYSFTLGDADAQAFGAAHESLTWYESTDTAALDALD